MNTKKQLIFTLYFALFGMVFGYGIFGILMAIAIPNFQSMYPITLIEKADFAKLSAMAEWPSQGQTALLVTMAILCVVGLGFIMKVLNPNMKETFKNRVGKVKGVVATSVLVGGLFFVGQILGEYSGSNIAFKELYFLASVLIFALIWLVCGQGGWGGSNESYGFGKKHDIKATLLYGVACGVVVAGVSVLLYYAFNKYIILIIEVFDESSEMSFKGYQLFRQMLPLMCTLYFAILAATVYALAPVSATKEERKVALRIPMALVVGMLVLFGITLGNADAKYDLKKKSLSEAAKLDTNVPEPRTVIIFGTEPEVKKWELKAEHTGYVGKGDIIASEQNIKKIEDYLASKGKRTVYTQTARDTLSKSMFLLWQPKRGREVLARYMDENLLARMLLIRYAERGPVDSETEGIVREFMDERKWHLSKRPLEKVAMILARQGKMDEAAEYLSRAKAAEGDSKIAFELPEKTPVTNGQISGRVLIDGKSPSGDTMIGLAGYGACGEPDKKIKPYLSEYSMTVLHNVVKASANGGYTFGSLGEGAYAVVLNAQSDVFSTKKDSFVVDGSPGMICISKDNLKVDAGTVQITSK